MPLVSDASPLNALACIGCVDILLRLFEQVLVPPAVVAELSQPATPEPARLFIRMPPIWLRVVSPSAVDRTHRLGAGEREAISLALEHRLPLLVDDKDARRTAQRAGLEIIGTIGTLEVAAQADLISLPDALAKLQATNFRAAKRLFDEALRRDAEAQAMTLNPDDQESSGATRDLLRKSRSTRTRCRDKESVFFEDEVFRYLERIISTHLTSI